MLGVFCSRGFRVALICTAEKSPQSAKSVNARMTPQSISSTQGPFVAMVWTKLGINLNPDKPISNLVLSVRPATIPDVQFPIFMVLCYWQLWKCRNGFIFRNEALNLKQVLASCKVETNLWRYRLPVP